MLRVNINDKIEHLYLRISIKEPVLVRFLDPTLRKSSLLHESSDIGVETEEEILYNVQVYLTIAGH